MTQTAYIKNISDLKIVGQNFINSEFHNMDESFRHNTFLQSDIKCCSLVLS